MVEDLTRVGRIAREREHLALRDDTGYALKSIELTKALDRLQVEHKRRVA